jgi:sulfate permease, SulP family
MLTDGATGDAFSSDLEIGGAMSDIASEQPAAVQPVVREVASGLVGSVLALAYAFSYAALIFTGPLAPFVGVGVATTLVTCTAVATIVAALSGFRLAVASPVSHSAAPLAAMVLAMQPILAGQAPNDALMLGLAALIVTTLLTGVALFVLGWHRLGKLVRFVPFPVVTGFLASTGWLITAGSLRTATNVPLRFDQIPALLEPRTALLLALTVAWAGALWLVTGRIKHYLALPAAMVGATIAVHAALFALGMTEGSARAAGLMFDMAGGGQPVPLLLTGEIFHLDWPALFPISGNMLAVVAMTIISVLLNSTGLELVDGVEVDLDRELKVHGIANMVSALCGGLVGHLSLSNTLANRAAGGSTRLSGIVVGLVALFVLIEGAQVARYIPRFVLCGLLLQLGLRLMWDWGVLARRKLPLHEWLVVVTIVAITAVIGFLPALLFGVFAICIIFALDVSRIGIIRRRFGLDQRTSMVVRSPAEMATLLAHGTRVQVLELGGVIFFGSAFLLQEETKRVLADRKPEAMVFDFSAVSGIDSSAGASFVGLRKTLRRSGARQVFVGLSPGNARTLELTGRADPDTEFHATLDEALEACEERLLAVHSAADQPADRALVAWLSEALSGLDRAQRLAAQLTAVEIAPHGTLCRQGEPTDRLLFIEGGRASVFVERLGEAPLRVRVFGPHTLIGEIGFFLDAPRTATVRVEGRATVWALDRESYREMNGRDPDLVSALLTYVVRLQAERLAFTTREVAAFQR